MASVETSYLDLLLEPVTRCFTVEMAKRLVSLPPDPTVQARIAELAEKANEGQLTDVDRAEYEEYIRAADLVTKGNSPTWIAPSTKNTSELLIW